MFNEEVRVSKKKIKRNKKKPALFSDLEKKAIKLIAEGKQVEDIMSILNLNIVETTNILAEIYKKSGG